MSTRRELVHALWGLPLLARTARSEAQVNPPANAGTDFLPYSESTARIISYTIYAEARGEPFDGKMAVASVIKTRAMRAKMPLAEVCLQSRQFSCWNDLKAVPDFFITGEDLQPIDLEARMECYGMAWVLMVSKRKWDYLTHFYNPDKVTPDWAFELKGTRIIGRHVFGYID